MYFIIKDVREYRIISRFGHVCLTDFPREELWPIDKFNDKILKDSRLQSKFATWQVIIIITISYYSLLYVKFFNSTRFLFLVLLLIVNN